MSDSEEDELTNVFNFPNNNTTLVSAKGPHINISNLRLNKPPLSTMYMPRNFEQQRYAESVYDQRSMYNRGETSSMSVQSYDVRPRNFQPYYLGMSSQRSMIDGRSVSSMSMRSTASVSAAEIAFAINNVKYNKHDLKVLKNACHQFMKSRMRKRVQKRRVRRLFLKGGGRMSDYDSGEQGSDSSLSSDDCKSYKENTSFRSKNTNLMDFQRTFNANNMFQGSSESFRQNTFKNKFSIDAQSISSLQNQNLTRQSTVTLKERFQNGFLLPTQRFNKSVAASTIPEKNEKPNKNTQNTSQIAKKSCYQNNNSVEVGSDSDEAIFSQKTNGSLKNENVHRIEPNHKRSLVYDDDINCPSKKRTKLSSPVKNAASKKINKKSTVANERNNTNNKNVTNFEFVVPTLPVKKGKPKEKLIARSAEPLTDSIEQVIGQPSTIGNPQPMNIEEEKSNDNQTQNEKHEITDVSMRPSFIKRKLFTQKLDVAEKANLSSDGVNSPRTGIYNALPKEKNKARKLVTNQSCLNRVVQDESNLLDLIHKIVPPDRMNGTNHNSINQTTKTEVGKNDDDKWDITSVISMCNDEDGSDTYTDEEIFKSKTVSKKPRSTPIKECIVMLKKMPNAKKSQEKIDKPQCSTTKKPPEPINKHQLTTISPKDVTNNPKKGGTKSFWDIDSESDMECYVPRRTNHSEVVKETPVNTVPHKEAGEIRNSAINMTRMKSPVQKITKTTNKSLMNIGVENARKNNLNIGNISFRSHRTSKRRICCENILLTNTTADGKNINQVPNKILTNIKGISKIQNKPESSSTSKPNTRLNASNESGQMKSDTDKRDRSVSNTRRKPHNDKSNLKLDERKRTTKADSNLNVSRPNTRLNASKENQVKSKAQNNTNDVSKHNTRNKSPKSKPKPKKIVKKTTPTRNTRKSKSVTPKMNEKIGSVKQKVLGKANNSKITNYFSSPQIKTPRNRSISKKR